MTTLPPIDAQVPQPVVPARLGKLARLSIRVRIALLQLAQRALQTRTARFVFRPVAYIVSIWAVWSLLRGGVESPIPEVAKQKEQLRQQWTARTAWIKSETRDSDRAFGQTLTWGVAGAGVIILATIIAAAKPSPALLVATGCLSLSVPLLVVLGFAWTIQTDPKARPPIVRDAVKLTGAIYLVNGIFLVGFAALLWSFSPWVVIAFLVGCYLALRYLGRFTKAHMASQSEQERPQP